VTAPYVAVELSDRIAVITLANPERRHALNDALLDELIAILDACSRQEVRAAILTADAVSGVWCSGYDISGLPQDGSMPVDRPFDRALRALRDAPFPVIAAVTGGAWGGGCNLALACDLIVAARDASFAITPAKLGVAYAAEGVAHFLGALPANIAREMFFTGDPVPATRLASLGVVNDLAEDGQAALARARELAEVIAQRAPLTVRSIKAEITAATDARETDAASLDSMRRAAWASADFAEGRRAFAERRAPDFEGR